MANRLRGEAEFEHDEVKYRLVMDASALIEAEDLTGMGLFDLAGAGMAKLGVLAALLLAAEGRGSALIADRGEAAELLLVAEGARDAVVKALFAALPEGKKEKAGSPNPQKAAGKAGTGESS